MKPVRDMTGFVCNTLTVIRREGTANGQAAWLCHCSCGRERVYSGGNLRMLSARCTCDGGQIRHGMTKEPLYQVWNAMKARCSQENYKSYDRYGGRGITVCQEWVHDFLAFRSWAQLNGWQAGLEIDRIDNDGGYTPENCRCVTSRENCRNKSNNVVLELNGERHTIVEWAEQLGVRKGLIAERLSRLGWSVERALTTPVTSSSKIARCQGANKRAV